MRQSISIIGLGKLGACMTVAIASRGYNVIGVDINRRTLDQISSGQAPFQEPELERLLTENRERIQVTHDCRQAISRSDLTFVVVPTPSDEQGFFSLKYARAAFLEIGYSLAEKKEYHNVVLTSTVLPGATRHALLPVLESTSGKVAGRDFGLCYSPEFIALGNVIQDFLHPDFVLIGEFNEDCGGRLAAFYSTLLYGPIECRRMSLENAELTKIAVNTYVTTKITFANMLADLCERLPGGDIDVVSGAVGLDRRVGVSCLKGGMGYGGPCFPRDNVALAAFARTMGAEPALAEITHVQNQKVPLRILGLLRRLAKSGQTVAILGLAYKPLTPVIDESQGIMLVKLLAQEGLKVIAWDAMAGEIAQSALEGHTTIYKDVDSCIARADVVIIALPDPRLKSANYRGKTVIDCWRLLADDLAGRDDVTYLALGRSFREQVGTETLRTLWRQRSEYG